MKEGEVWRQSETEGFILSFLHSHVTVFCDATQRKKPLPVIGWPSFRHAKPI
jgi:hypothetical protein